MNWVAIVVAAVLAFVESTGWYIAFADQRARLLGTTPDRAARRPPAAKVLAELARNAIFAVALSALIGALGVADLAGAVRRALLLWVVFPVMILAGSVMWESVPWRLAAIHAGDWIVKLVLLTALLEVWR